jgi:hypothetical protein
VLYRLVATVEQGIDRAACEGEAIIDRAPNRSSPRGSREELLGELGILRHGTRHGLLEELAGGRQSETAAREL